MKSILHLMIVILPFHPLVAMHSKGYLPISKEETVPSFLDMLPQEVIQTISLLSEPVTRAKNYCSLRETSRYMRASLDKLPAELKAKLYWSYNCTRRPRKCPLLSALQKQYPQQLAHILQSKEAFLCKECNCELKSLCVADKKYSKEIFQQLQNHPHLNIKEKRENDLIHITNPKLFEYIKYLKSEYEPVDLNTLPQSKWTSLVLDIFIPSSIGAIDLLFGSLMRYRPLKSTCFLPNHAACPTLDHETNLQTAAHYMFSLKLAAIFVFEVAMILKRNSLIKHIEKNTTIQNAFSIFSLRKHHYPNKLCSFRNVSGLIFSMAEIVLLTTIALRISDYSQEFEHCILTCGESVWISLIMPSLLALALLISQIMVINRHFSNR